jgi:hypothetical protein
LSTLRIKALIAIAIKMGGGLLLADFVAKVGCA